MNGTPVDFSHGDVDAHPPTPGSAEAWQSGFEVGGQQAYTEYRGAAAIREKVAARLAEFTGHPLDADSELIITPGTQGALFLALGATVTNGTKVAVVEPDYFANRKLVVFFGGEMVPVALNYGGQGDENGPDLSQLEAAFKSRHPKCWFSRIRTTPPVWSIPPPISPKSRVLLRATGSR